MNVDDEVTINHRLHAVLRGKKAKVERISTVTGLVTVRLLEDAGAYKAGEKLHVKQYEVTRNG